MKKPTISSRTMDDIASSTQTGAETNIGHKRLYMSLPHDVVAELLSFHVSDPIKREYYLNRFLRAEVAATEVLTILHAAMSFTPPRTKSD